MTQEQTPEEKKFEEIQNFQMQQLKSNARIVSANDLKKDYGVKGANIAEEIMSGENVLKAKQQIFEQRKEEAKTLGLAYNPEMPTNYETAKIAKQIDIEAKQVLTFGNLEKMAKESLPGLDLEVAEKFKNTTYASLTNKLTAAKGDFTKLDKETQDALRYHTMLSEAYADGNMVATMQNSSLAKYNAMGKELAEKYRPKTDSKESE